MSDEDVNREYGPLGSGPGPDKFWDDYFRRDGIEKALKVAAPDEAQILQMVLRPIVKRQDEYDATRQAEYVTQQEQVQARIAAFTKKQKEQH